MIELYSIPVEQYVLSAFMSFNQGMDDFIEQLEAEDFMHHNTKSFLNTFVLNI